MSVNLHACAREQLRDTPSRLPQTFSTSMDAWACSALRVSTIPSKFFPHGLPLNVENRVDSVGEVPWLRIEHLWNQIVREELFALQGMCEAFTSSSLSS